MHYNYVDIGTSNFDTSAKFAIADPSINVLLVEPLDFYLNSFKRNNIKLCNCAISDTDSLATIYFLPEEYIQKTFPDKLWLRGCNKVDVAHNMVLVELQRLSIDTSVIHQREIRKITFTTLCDEFDITSIGQLKIDTEGHECLILPLIIQKIKNGMKIQSLFIENNGNSDPVKIENLFTQFMELNYTRINYPYDVELILK
jgi:FkbM family methyltransferase